MTVSKKILRSNCWLEHSEAMFTNVHCVSTSYLLVDLFMHCYKLTVSFSIKNACYILIDRCIYALPSIHLVCNKNNKDVKTNQPMKRRKEKCTKWNAELYRYILYGATIMTLNHENRAIWSYHCIWDLPFSISGAHFYKRLSYPAKNYKKLNM